MVQSVSQLKSELSNHESDVLEMQTRLEKIQRNGDPDSFFDEDNTHKAKAMKELDQQLADSEQELAKITGEISLIEDEMEEAMQEIMRLGIDTLHLDTELENSWNFTKIDQDQLNQPSFDKKRVTKENV